MLEIYCNQLNDTTVMELFHELAGASGALVCEKGSFGSLEAYRFDAIENSCFSVPSEIEKAS